MRNLNEEGPLPFIRHIISRGRCPFFEHIFGKKGDCHLFLARPNNILIPTRNYLGFPSYSPLDARAN
jgi:hypothetical protein